MAVPAGFVENTLAALERVHHELQEMGRNVQHGAEQNNRLRAELLEMIATDRPAEKHKRFDQKHCRITPWDGSNAKFRHFEFH